MTGENNGQLLMRAEWKSKFGTRKQRREFEFDSYTSFLSEWGGKRINMKLHVLKNS